VRVIYRLGPLVLMLSLSSSPLFAQIPNCGQPQTSHMMRQQPNYKLGVEVSASTSLPLALCSFQLQTEVWVDGLSSYVSIKRALYSASVYQARNVPSYGTWHSTAKHWVLTSPSWTDLGRTFANAVVYPPPSADNQCEMQASDCPEGYEYLAYRCDCRTLSPILIDTAGDGYRLTSAEDGVEFDLNDNGVASERVAWTEVDSDDGWLVLDRNSNGQIDSGAELFGSKTPAYADAVDPRTANGFEALLMTEGPSYGGGVADGTIDARDAIYSRLRVWLDRDHNGKADAGELHSLDSLGIVALGTSYKKIGRRDQHGNEFSLVGDVVFRDTHGGSRTRKVYDVYLTVFPAQTTAEATIAR
jgi:hypothetical protein